MMRFLTGASFVIPIVAIAAIIGIGGWYALRQNGALGSVSSDGVAFSPAAPTKDSGCRVSGRYPDPGCTPGKILADVTKNQVCADGYAASVSGISNAQAAQIYAAYGIARHAAGQYEIDRLVPSILGGSNDTANLWPQAAVPKPGYREKDAAEAYLHAKVCGDAISLADAQRSIDKDWYSVYSQSLAN